MKKWVMTAVLLCLAATVPATGVSQTGAPVVSPGAAAPAGPANGRVDYKAKCANCHGANALMTVRTARKLGVDPRKLSLMASKMNREEMIAIIARGNEKMPGFEKDLSPERIAGIADYLIENRDQKLKKESLIRVKEPISRDHAPIGAPEKGPGKAPGNSQPPK